MAARSLKTQSDISRALAYVYREVTETVWTWPRPGP